MWGGGAKHNKVWRAANTPCIGSVDCELDVGDQTLPVLVGEGHEAALEEGFNGAVEALHLTVAVAGIWGGVVVADVVGGEEGRCRAGKLRTVVCPNGCRSSKNGDNVVFQDPSNSCGSTVGDKPQHAKFAVAADGCEQMHLLRVGRAKGGDQV